MDQELALTLAKSSFLNPSVPDRIWAVVYPDKTTFYLTDEERGHFLKELASGKTIIQIGSLTLTGRFNYIYQFKNKPEKKEYIQVDENTLREV